MLLLWHFSLRWAFTSGYGCISPTLIKMIHTRMWMFRSGPTSSTWNKMYLKPSIKATKAFQEKDVKIIYIARQSSQNFHLWAISAFLYSLLLVLFSSTTSGEYSTISGRRGMWLNPKTIFGILLLFSHIWWVSLWVASAYWLLILGSINLEFLSGWA